MQQQENFWAWGECGEIEGVSLMFDNEKDKKKALSLIKGVSFQIKKGSIN